VISTRTTPWRFRMGVLAPDFTRRRWITLGLFALSMILAYETAGYIISGNLQGLVYIGMAFVAAAFVIAILNNWRNGLYFFLVWLLFEDLARKYLGNNMAIYFAKDFLLAVVYLSFFVAWRRKPKEIQIFRPPFRLALLVLIWFAFMQMFNPATTHFMFGPLGLKLYFYYVPLLFVGYALIESEKDLRRFFFVNFVLIVIIGSLGIVQAIVGPRFLNPAVLADDIRNLSESYRTAPISGVRAYRPTSVYVSTSRFTDLLIVAWMMVFGFTGYLLLRHRRGRTFGFVTLAIIAGACLMCTSRGLFMWSLGSAIVGALAFVWGAPWRQGEALRIIRALQRAALGIGLAVGVLLFTYPEALLNRIAVYSETLDPRSPTSELVHRTRDYPLANMLSAFDYPRWFYGYGLGTASLGAQYVYRFFHVRAPELPVESGFGNLVLEMGVGGLVLWLIMSTAVVLSAWKVTRFLKGSPYFPLAFMIFLYAFILLFPITFTGSQGYQDFIMNAYLWLLLGVLFRLPKMALSEQFSMQNALPARRWIR
jgi:hypothetical protein